MGKPLNQEMHEKKEFGKVDKEFNFKYIQFEGPRTSKGRYPEEHDSGTQRGSRT